MWSGRLNNLFNFGDFVFDGLESLGDLFFSGFDLIEVQFFAKDGGFCSGEALNHDADEEVNHDHGADDDKADEEEDGDNAMTLRVCAYGDGALGVVDIGSVVGGVHDVGPILEGDDAKERDHGEADIAKMRWIIIAKEKGGEDGVDVEEKGEEDAHVEHGGQRPQKGVDENLQLRDLRDEASGAENAGEANNGDPWTGAGDQAEGDDSEIENVPTVFEIVLRPGQGSRQFEKDLDTKNGDYQTVHEFEVVSILRVDGLTCFQSNDNRGEEDDEDDESLKDGMINDRLYVGHGL